MIQHFLVSGLVQGVGYRNFTARVAGELGLRGRVRNLTNGQVEAVAIGSEAALTQFEVFLWQGPPRAQVQKIEKKNIVVEIKETGFNILETGGSPWSFDS